MGKGLGNNQRDEFLSEWKLMSAIFFLDIDEFISFWRKDGWGDGNGGRCRGLKKIQWEKTISLLVGKIVFGVKFIVGIIYLFLLFLSFPQFIQQFLAISHHLSIVICLKKFLPTLNLRDVIEDTRGWDKCVCAENSRGKLFLVSF